MNLSNFFLKLKQETNTITNNWLLNCFTQEDLSQLDELSTTDAFIAEKKKSILNYIKDTGIDFDPKLKSAYDEYSEAMFYLILKRKFKSVDHIKEGSDKTPDFKIQLDPERFEEQAGNPIVFAELKSMAFASGNLNYMESMQQAFEAKIDLDEQRTRGRKVATAFHGIQPIKKDSKTSGSDSIRYTIETIIDKVDQNVKQGQYGMGDTVLVVDLKQLKPVVNHKEAALPIFYDEKLKSYMSGILWYIAFGKAGHLIFKPEEFEGKGTIDGELEREGILTRHSFIQGLVFLSYTLGETSPKIIGFKRENHSDQIAVFLKDCCDFVNDDKNYNGWQVQENNA